MTSFDQTSAGREELKGVLPAIITPFTADYEIDEQTLRELTDSLVERGVHGIVVGGSAGEYVLQSMEERKRVFDIVMDQVRGTVPVIFGTTALRTEDVIALTAYGKENGSVAVMVSPHCYHTLDEQELYLYYKEISAVGLPIICYNIPSHCAGADLKPEFLLRLAEDGVIDYVKESTGDLRRMHKIASFKSSKLKLLGGWDDLIIEAYLFGAIGWISGIPNFIPKPCVEMYRLAVEKHDIDAAREIFLTMLPLLSMFEEGGGKYERYVKAGVEVTGRKVGPPRRPLMPASEKEKNAIRDALTKAGMI